MSMDLIILLGDVENYFKLIVFNVISFIIKLISAKWYYTLMLNYFSNHYIVKKDVISRDNICQMSMDLIIYFNYQVNWNNFTWWCG